MRRLRIALYLVFAGQGTLAGTVHARQAACTDLSTTTPNWQISNAASSDWPGGGGGRVELFAKHVPTSVTAACDVEYSMNATDGTIVDYDPAASHECINFGTSALNTSVRLDMDTLLLTLRSSWACEEDETTVYTATGSTSLQRDTSPGVCRVEPTQLGDATTCAISNAEVEGVLGEER